jgi:hypothetical protein
MFVLQIEHEVFDFDSWKKDFDNDLNGRQKAGVHQYEIFCLSDNPNYVILHLWYEYFDQATISMALLRNLWNADISTQLKDPQVRIFDMVDWSFIE